MSELVPVAINANEWQVSVVQDPRAVIEEARQAAICLKDVVDKKPKKVVINNETYLEFEDWQTVAKFYGISARIAWTKYVQYGEASGFEACAEAVHASSHSIVSSAESMCLNDEERWRERPLFQLRSMAQTRAAAKALRNCLAWVVVLAGYKPTPAEEMDGVKPDSGPASEQGHWCKIHGIAFFKRGKMKSYAHPIGDTGEWCHESTKADAPEASKQAMKEPAPQSTDQGETGATVAEPLQEVFDNIEKPPPPQKPQWPLIVKYCKALGVPVKDLPKALGLPGDDVNQWKGSHEAALDKLETYARKNHQYVGPAWKVIKLV